MATGARSGRRSTRAHFMADGTRPEMEDAANYHDPDPLVHRPPQGLQTWSDLVRPGQWSAARPGARPDLVSGSRVSRTRICHDSGWGGFFRWVSTRCVRLVREWWLCGLPNLLLAGRPGQSTPLGRRRRRFARRYPLGYTMFY